MYCNGSQSTTYLTSLEIGLRCIKLQKPPRVHSLQENDNSEINVKWTVLVIIVMNTLANVIILEVFSTQMFALFFSNSILGSIHDLCMTNVPLLCCLFSRNVPHFILPTTGLPEVSHWGELSVNRQTIEPAVIQLLDSFLSILLIAKLKPSVCVCVCVLGKYAGQVCTCTLCQYSSLCAVSFNYLFLQNAQIKVKN